MDTGIHERARRLLTHDEEDSPSPDARVVARQLYERLLAAIARGKLDAGERLLPLPDDVSADMLTELSRLINEGMPGVTATPNLRDLTIDLAPRKAPRPASSFAGNRHERRSQAAQARRAARRGEG